MSWIHSLIETYEKNEHLAGDFSSSSGSNADSVLIPLCHTVQNADLEILLNRHGEAIEVNLIQKKEAPTLIPCTISSMVRTSGAAAHPLHDNLQYLSKNYANWFGVKSHNELYKEQIEDWMESPQCHEKVKVVYRYIEEHDIIEDLIRFGIYTKEEGRDGEIKLITEHKLPAKPFVRFRVSLGDYTTSKLWADKEVQASYQEYYLDKLAKQGEELCYASGTKNSIAEFAPKNIIKTASGAKIISSNDSKNFTFRGRFAEKEEAFSLSYEASQKAHNALKWLIRNQGYQFKEKMYLCWGTRNEPVPVLLEDDYGLENFAESTPSLDTGRSLSNNFVLSLQGITKDLDVDNIQIRVMVMEASTPGRISITYYREITGGEFFENLKLWHLRSEWDNQYWKEKKIVFYVGAPSLRSILKCCYGEKAQDKLLNHGMERLFSSVVDGRKVPWDMVQTLIVEASKPQGKEGYLWLETLKIACSMYRNYMFDKEEYSMALDEQRSTRDYLYGRLLAVADHIESSTYGPDEKRMTNARRMMTVFSHRPYKTWQLIQEKLIPYQEKLEKEGYGYIYSNLLDTIGSLFDPEEFISNKPLTGEYLIGYYSQRKKISDDISQKSKEKKEREAQKNA